MSQNVNCENFPQFGVPLKQHLLLGLELGTVYMPEFPLVGGTGGDPPTTRKIGLSSPMPSPPTVLTQKCQFCYFHAVFGHFFQIVPPLVDPN